MAKKEKDPVAVQIGARCKQAREMGGFKTQADLVAILQDKYGWGKSKLGTLESGQNRAGIEEVEAIATETGASACWIMFGSGPIRANDRSLQAIRYQNLVHSVEPLKNDVEQYKTFLQSAESSEKAIRKYLDNPFEKIGDRQARRFERALERPKGWLDQQHVDVDPILKTFPDDMKELMMLYSEMDESLRLKTLDMIKLLIDK